MIGRGSSNDFEAVGATVMVTFVGFMDLNSPHQSSAFIVGQQLGLPAGGYLRQVLSALKNWQSLQKFITSEAAERLPEPVAAAD